MTKYVTTTRARKNLSSLVQNAKKRMDEYIITVNGLPAAVLMSIDEYESWQETNEIMSDPGLVKAIKEGEGDLKRGRYVTLEQLKKNLKRHVQSSHI